MASIGELALIRTTARCSTARENVASESAGGVVVSCIGTPFRRAGAGAGELAELRPPTPHAAEVPHVGADRTPLRTAGTTLDGDRGAALGGAGGRMAPGAPRVPRGVTVASLAVERLSARARRRRTKGGRSARMPWP